MDDRKKPRLGTVQETLLIPLYARAVENRKEHALLRDARAEEIAASIDYDFKRFDDLPSLTGALLRTLLFDRWVADFLSAHPDATVVEIGTGLNTRHERVDNGRARWFDLDLPDVIALRRNFFTDSPRRTMIAASVTDEAWAAEVASHATGPYLFVAEAVLPYLHEPDVRRVIDLLADRFPGALLALDTAGPGFFDTQEQHDALSKVEARMHWYCPDPAQLADWRPGTRVLASHTLTSLPEDLVAQLPLPYQQLVSAIAAQRLPQAEGYRLNLLRLP
ncbi:class I SAM-dependent methyltransferase [Streptomyces sp. TRM S81-3]|uniref:Class I SAM-dependent methyltransferase n=1 Tax=Streptomyces griseicoloratus TaxID=2752516 RepID=A0A926KVZ0_9ACTN|nr:class I SAM-dependent methyltransferase [Streptomyces griseicoloratus]MBD0417857.1 class I SAM-dependent methyltransferase [Streptomyces griseicoloratus]